jgi:serine/threonine-protein kinase
MSKDIREPPQDDSMLGVVLDGRWRLLGRLGEGAMGEVYRAERIKLGRKVAVKLLSKLRAQSQAFIARFEREARAISRLNHVHCVSILDFGLHEGRPYIVMELVDGRRLTEEIGQASTKRAVSLVRQLLVGLRHAHTQGVLHRDLKPDNIMLHELSGTGDIVKILDFGFAHIVDGEHSITGKQMVAGTPSYMSPEQSTAQPLDHRSDIYSVGVVLYELCVGRKPFSSDDMIAVLRMHITKPPPRPRAAAPDRNISEKLERVILRALAKDREERFSDAAAFIAALDTTPEGREASRLKLGTPVLGEQMTHELSLSQIIGEQESPLGTLATPTGSASTSKADERRSITPRPRRWRYAVLLVLVIGLGVLTAIRHPHGVDWLLERLEGRPVARGPVDAASPPTQAMLPASQAVRSSDGSSAVAETITRLDAPAVDVLDGPDAGRDASVPEGDAAPPPSAQPDSLGAGGFAAVPPPASDASKINPPAAEVPPAPEGSALPTSPPQPTAPNVIAPPPAAPEASASALPGLRGSTTLPTAPTRSPEHSRIEGLIAAHRLAEADRLLMGALRRNPNDAWVHFGLGSVYFLRIWRDDALREWDQALELDPRLVQNATLRQRVCTALDARSSGHAARLVLRRFGRDAETAMNECLRVTRDPTAQRTARRILEQIKQRR